jgi:plastocyanin
MKSVALCFLFTAGQVAFGGTISGVVKFKGEKPTPKPFAGIAASSFCNEHAAPNGVTPLSDRFVFGKHGGDDTLANVLVYVSKGLEGKNVETPKTPVVIDQVNCIYQPHVVAVMAGQPLEIRNSDATLHNVMTRPRSNPGFNEGMPTKNSKLMKTFNKPELGIDLKCFMHPWMVGYVHVLENPFYAITKPDGTFEIKGLPAGEYEVTVFHEFSRFSPEQEKMSVKVGESDTKQVTFVYSMPSR